MKKKYMQVGKRVNYKDLNIIEPPLPKERERERLVIIRIAIIQVLLK